MLNRRNFLFSTTLATLFSEKVSAENVQSLVNAKNNISWFEFQKKMMLLADLKARGKINNEAVTKQGMTYLQQLNIHSSEFNTAVNDSYESGNRYWLWQRLLKSRNINGGILNIGNDQLVQLHDHPGATGLLRIISGETEVWQFDQVKEEKTVGANNIVRLERTSHVILRAGDTAILTPSKGNIHALKSVTKECRMLDFFIPPYVRSQRSWYQPVRDKWFYKKNIICKKISQNDFTVT